MRMIHTADVHLDACFARAGMPPSYGNRRRQGLRDAFHGIIARAGAWPADALLIAGDLFEHDHVTRDTIAFLQREFASIPEVAVYIAPGNHDPCMENSPYLSETWPANVHVFRAPQWTAAQHPRLPLTIHGFAFDGPDISQNPFGALRVPSDERTHIAIGHGSERSRQPAEKSAYAPFAAQEAASPGLTYLALGHFHAAAHITGPFETSVWYSGSPQGCGFGEPGPHHYLEVELRDGVVHVTPALASHVEFATYAVDCSGMTTSQELIDYIRALAAGREASLLIRAVLTGTASTSLSAAFDAVRDALTGVFEFIDLVDQTAPEEDFDALGRERTALGLFVARVNEEIAETSDADRLRLLARSRVLGVAAYRGAAPPIPGLEGGRP